MTITRAPAPSGEQLAEARKAARDAWKTKPGVTGFGIGDGVVRVYVLNADVAQGLPNEIQGVPLEFVVTGDIKAD